jgi:hypothetical protein
VPAVICRFRAELRQRFMVVAVTNPLVAAVGRVVERDSGLEHSLNIWFLLRGTGADALARPHLLLMISD